MLITSYLLSIHDLHVTTCLTFDHYRLTMESATCATTTQTRRKKRKSSLSASRTWSNGWVTSPTRSPTVRTISRNCTTMPSSWSKGTWLMSAIKPQRRSRASTLHLLHGEIDQRRKAWGFSRYGDNVLLIQFVIVAPLLCISYVPSFYCFALAVCIHHPITPQ